MKTKLEMIKEPDVGTIEAGNSIYRVFVQDIPEQAVGVYTATTGENHPLGPGRNMLWGSGLPGTSFNTFRSYTTMTDYTVDSLSESAPPFIKVNIRPFATSIPIGDSGVRTTYVLPGPPATPDALTIIQDVEVVGDTFENSYIRVRVEIINNNNIDTKIGIRYLWDLLIGSDDGPALQSINPIGSLITNETEFIQPQIEALQFADNDSNPNPPTYIVYGSARGPGNLSIGPLPTRIQYAYWAASRANAFDYTINPDRNISSPPYNDSAVLYYWGHDRDTAITLDANGGSFTAAAALFSTKPGIVPSFINSHICISANRIFDVCRLEETHTRIIDIPSSECDVLLGCEVKQARCYVCQLDEADNSDDIIQLQVALKIAYMFKTHCSVTSVVRPFVFTTAAQLSVPDNAAVNCEVQNPTCESRQLENGFVETTVHASIKLQSVGTESIVIPFVASCPVGLCPGIPASDEEQDSAYIASDNADEDDD